MTLNDVLLDERKALISGPFGSDISKKFFVQSGVPVIRGNNLALDSRKFIDEGFVFVDELKAEELNAYAEKNDLIFTAAGTIGQVGMIPNKSKYPKYIISNKQLRARLNPKVIDYQFAYYWFSSPWIREEIINKNTGSTIPLINLSVLRSLPIILPNLFAQQKIAAVLSALDDKIELANRINAELEAMAKTLYDYWFVQFDFPDAAGRPYKTAGGNMVWSERLKREIPEGWEDGTLENLGEIVGGSTPSREVEEYFSTNGTAWITPKDLSMNGSNKFISKGELDVTEKGLKAASLKLLPKGSILLSSRAPIGYIAVAGNVVTTNQGFKSFVPNKGFSTPYVFYAIKNAVPQIISNASGSTFKEVSGGTLKTISIILPNKPVVDAFTKKVEAIFEKQYVLERENYELAALRDWLLPMLMNGQVSVGEAYAQAAEALSMAAEGEQEYK